VPEVFTVMLLVVAPLLQKLPAALLLVSVTDPPEQKVVGPLAEITGVTSAGFTTTVVAALVALQPLASVTVTV
jgi:hypothetical protein